MPALPPKPLPRPLPKPLPKAPPKAGPSAAPTPVATPSAAPLAAKPDSVQDHLPESLHASFLIGPPGAPEDMKALYERAGQQLQNGDDRLSKKLFEVRYNIVKYIISPDAKQKSMLQRILEERLGKDLKKVQATIGQAYHHGEIVPNLIISLEESLYVDGSAIGTDLSVEIAKALESVFGVIFKAQWVQSTVR